MLIFYFYLVGINIFLSNINILSLILGLFFYILKKEKITKLKVVSKSQFITK